MAGRKKIERTPEYDTEREIVRVVQCSPYNRTPKASEPWIALKERLLKYMVREQRSYSKAILVLLNKALDAEDCAVASPEDSILD